MFSNKPSNKIGIKLIFTNFEEDTIWQHVKQYLSFIYR